MPVKEVSHKQFAELHLQRRPALAPRRRTGGGCSAVASRVEEGTIVVEGSGGT
jgi:hypothetical protein